MDLKSRFTGCLIGLALGDALGAPFEGSPSGKKSLQYLPPVLHYSDDTEMSIGVTESLIAEKGFNPDDMAERFYKNFNIRRGYGAGTISVLRLIKKGMHWSEANKKVFPQGSFGNGAAMRAAPIGLFYFNDSKNLKEVTYTASSITHDHPLAKEGALLITTAVSEILQGRTKEEILESLLHTSEIKEYQEKLKTVESFLQKDITAEDVISALGNSVLALESVPSAIYAFLKYGEDYLKTVEFCLSLGGDTDTISAMAGALSGAYVGIENLPEEFIERLEDKDKLQGLSLELLERVINP